MTSQTHLTAAQYAQLDIAEWITCGLNITAAIKFWWCDESLTYSRELQQNLDTPPIIEYLRTTGCDSERVRSELTKLDAHLECAIAQGYIRERNPAMNWVSKIGDPTLEYRTAQDCSKRLGRTDDHKGNVFSPSVYRTFLSDILSFGDELRNTVDTRTDRKMLAEELGEYEASRRRVI